AEKEPTPEKDSKIAESDEPKDDGKKDEKKIDPTAEAMEREEKLRKIIDSKKYNVNIKQAHGSRRGLVWALIGLLIAGLLGLFVAIDTGNLDLGFKLPFTIFGEKEKTSSVDNQSAQAQSVNEVPANNEEQKSVSEPTEYSFEHPSAWTFMRSTEILDGEEYFTDSYELPLGVKIIVKKDYGGKGGTCEPKTGDVPHKAGNACPTLEYLKKESLELNQGTVDKLLFADNPKIFLTNRKITEADSGKSIFEACLETFDAGFNPDVNDPYMGAVFGGCAGGIATKDYTLLVSITNIDPDGLFDETGLVDNDSLKAAEEALMTFELL
ncbi:hypothetical protein KC959_01805, partial [Candidatus Saccharibacteria bacterium]|nr:hypothetical protein [Candidatus Saccharibacteria bacterium]